MRDVVFAVLAVFLLFVALGLATSLTGARRRRQRQQHEIAARGQVVLAELPTGDGITFFTADDEAFHYGGRRIPKDSIQAARVLINGAPIAASLAPGYADTRATPADVVDDRPEGLSRDRWDVAIETGGRDRPRRVRRHPGAHLPGPRPPGVRRREGRDRGPPLTGRPAPFRRCRAARRRAGG